MKILMISSYLPFPLDSGGHVRLYNLIKELSLDHEITLICEKRENQTESDIDVLIKICKKVITVNRRKQWTIKNVFNSVFSSNSFLVTGHTIQEMKQEINVELENEKYDLIHVETYYVMQNLPSTSIPVVLAEHNIEYQVYQKYADKKNPLLRLFLKYDIAKIEKEEVRVWKTADKLIAVSQADKKVMEKAGLRPRIVANGVDTEKFSFLQRTENREQRTKKVLFIGDFKWIQNRDAVRFIFDEIWPEIERRSGDSERSVEDSRISNGRNKSDPGQARTRLWIVGRKIPNSIKSLTNNPNVVFDEEGSSRSTEELFQEADVLLAPIRVGGGTSYKILESMSCGTPVITTLLSANAVGAEDCKNIMASNDAKELAKKTIEVLVNKNLYEKIAENGRKLIEENYTWKNISKDLENVYKTTI